MSDLDGDRYRDQGFSPALNAAEQAIFEISLNYTKVPVEQRSVVRAQLDHLASAQDVRMGYEILAGNTRKKIKRLGKS